MPILALHHVQLAMPQNQEVKARQFFVDLLGFVEVQKPAALAKRGGLWLENGAVNLHLGVEENFRPAKKAHPAFLVDDLEAFASIFVTANVAIERDGDLPGFKRFYVHDPFGNRIEILENV